MSADLLPTTTTTANHSYAFSFDGAQLLNRMFSRRKSTTSPKTSITSATPLDETTQGEGEEDRNRRRSTSDLPASKVASGRRKSDDINSPKKPFLARFRRRSKDILVDQLPKSPAAPEEQKKMILEDIGRILPEAKHSKPKVCHTASEPSKTHASVLELSGSPKRFGLNRSFDHMYYDSHGRLSATPPPGSVDEEFIYKCPSSPLLVAVRTAVDSLSQYNDFDILEKIGSGFYAEVFKVS